MSHEEVKLKHLRSAVQVTHVSSAHRWTDNRVHFREAVGLAKAGYGVSLVAVEHDLAAPETNVRVVLLPERKRAARLVVGSLQAIREALRLRPDVLHLHDPELIWAIPFLKAIGKVVIYDAHEDLPSQVLSKHYLRPAYRKIISRFARLVVRVASISDQIIAATEAIASTFPETKTVVVHNYPRLSETDLSAPIHRRDKVVTYIGALSRQRGAEEMIRAFAHPSFPRDWKVEIAGSTSPASLLDHLRCLPGWKRVTFHGQVAPIEARNLLSQSRVGLLLFQRNAAHLESLPTKMFEYFAEGVPVIASDFPLWRSIVSAHNCGLLVDETDPAAIANAIRRYAEDEALLSLHSANAQAVAEGLLNWDSEERILVATYDRVTRIRRG